MTAERWRQIKATLLIVMLAVAEVRNVEATVSSSAFNRHSDRDDEQMSHFAPSVEAIIASPSLQQQAKFFAEQMTAMMDDPSLQAQARTLAEQMQATSTSSSPQDQAKLMVEYMESMMANPSFNERARSIAEEMKLMTTSQDFQEQVQRLAEQAEKMRTDSNFQEQAKIIAEQIGAMKADPKFQEEMKRVAKQMKAMMTDLDLQAFMEQAHGEAATSRQAALVDRLSDRAFSAKSLHQADLERTTLGKTANMGLAQSPRFAQHLRKAPGFASASRMPHFAQGMQVPTSSVVPGHQHIAGSRMMPAAATMEKSDTATALSSPSNEAAASPLPTWALVPSSIILQVATAAQTLAGASDYEYQGWSASYWTIIALFLLTVPGVWSIVKRSPKATVKRITYELPGPAAGGKDLDTVARTIAGYFKKYNYRITGTGEVITFTGTYEASRGQAAATTFYFFCGLASIALVLSVAVPKIGPLVIEQYWYGLTLLSPLAWVYYTNRGTRDEDVKVKMISTDDEKITDLVIEGDKEEIERFSRELQLMEKGKVYVRGFFEQDPEKQPETSN
eukprot:gnl/TRDRNA2_/TRDRNA2_147356_c1_seq1.p1 gnl/TRDRNA2_/TRDRNA2_147356_c1~~gnl/TRDRNA2_/TRDRNA2_147356_c1_seq1.p1  ORF type:complete len:562 (-),score=119.01 gnl/TRDRNA2_/TRDRNA2_147356_c1_seq1:143-1828(-)